MSIQKHELHWYEHYPHKPGKGKSAKKESTRAKSFKGRLPHLEEYMDDTNTWLEAIALNLNVTDKNRTNTAFKALRGVMHGLRDRLNPDEVFNLSAQLPVLVRGILFEGYNLKDKPEKYDAAEMLRRIKLGLGEKSKIAPEKAFKAVLATLYHHVSEGELRDIYSNMPRDIKKLWYDTLRNMANDYSGSG